MNKDSIFSAQQDISDFCFDQSVVNVFDDMVGRSVPFYQEIQRMAVELAADYATEGSYVCDLGCATGTTLAALHEKLSPDITLVGIDNSPDMLEKCREKLASALSQRDFSFCCKELHPFLQLSDISVATCILTLQFIRPFYRQELLTSLCNATLKGGALILVEKVVTGESAINRRFIHYYYEMKRRHGYSETEISQKREALENVLIPYTQEENIYMLKKAGYSHVEVFFKWYNFCGMVALK